MEIEYWYIDKAGYYYSEDRSEIMQAGEGSKLPDADWEYLGGLDEMTPAEAVAVVEERYPDVSTELRFKSLYAPQESLKRR